MPLEADLLRGSAWCRPPRGIAGPSAASAVGCVAKHHYPEQQEPAREATDPRFQDQLIGKLTELTGVELPEA